MCKWWNGTHLKNELNDHNKLYEIHNRSFSIQICYGLFNQVKINFIYCHFCSTLILSPVLEHNSTFLSLGDLDALSHQLPKPTSYCFVSSITLQTSNPSVALFNSLSYSLICHRCNNCITFSFSCRFLFSLVCFHMWKLTWNTTKWIRARMDPNWEDDIPTLHISIPSFMTC